MAVSKKIVDLTRLALQDRVLTYTERQTIVKVALDEGISEQEINAFLDNMLAQRLKSFTKEELRNCPSCGGQIPLISDQCLRHFFESTARKCLPCGCCRRGGGYHTQRKRNHPRAGTRSQKLPRLWRTVPYVEQYLHPLRTRAPRA